MPLSEILEIGILWATGTFIGFFAINKYKGERAALFGGMAFLALGVVVPMFISITLYDYLVCSKPICEAGKTQAKTLIDLFTFSWTAIGANLLAAVLSHK